MNRRNVIKLMGAAPLLNLLAVKQLQAAAYLPETNTDTQLLVFGATPGGIACSIRAAREGLKVTLVSTSRHLGGMMVNGLGIFDTLYNGSRAPLYDEFRKMIYDYYRNTYGTDSVQYKSSGPGISKTMYEAKVAEQLIDTWLKAEPNITIYKEYYPVSVIKAGGRIKETVFRSMDEKAELKIAASVFADCSYEGDLLGISGADYIIGRESKQEYGEEYAGVIYTKDEKIPAGSEPTLQQQISRRLNLYRYSERRTVVMPGSTGEADRTLQGFNLRTILTDDPDNLYFPEKPANYDPAHFKAHYTHTAEKLTLSRPNNKSSLPYPEILGLQNKYVEGDWNTRRLVIQQYKDEVNGLLYYRQNDPSLPAELREHWRKYGLAKDEFPDNDHIPYDLYVREARRLKGKVVFTQHDALLAEGLHRAPIHTDSIIATDWFLDSHACTERTIPGSKEEGHVMLRSETVPGQVPLALLFPNEPANLIVPVCLSASHIGWGALRLEPVWMSVGEAAAWLLIQAVRQKVDPPAVNADMLIRHLAQQRFLLSFFNDMEGRESASWYPAVQYLGTKGFFGSYDSRADQKLTTTLAGRWTEQLKNWRDTGNWKANEEAKQTLKAESMDGDPVLAAAFATAIERSVRLTGQGEKWLNTLSIKKEAILTRGDAARIIFEAIGNSSTSVQTMKK